MHVSHVRTLQQTLVVSDETGDASCAFYLKALAARCRCRSYGRRRPLLHPPLLPPPPSPTSDTDQDASYVSPSRWHRQAQEQDARRTARPPVHPPAPVVMNIWIETPVEGTIMLDVELSETIGSLRQQLQGMITLPPHLYIHALLHDGIHLNDALTLGRYEMKEDTILTLYLTQRRSPNL